MTETAEQDKVIIWGTDSQCDDPELAEFEMLECQELEAYLVEEGEDFEGLAEKSKPQEEPSSSCKTTETKAVDDMNWKGTEWVVGVACEQESSVSHVSDTDVFVTCLSTTATLTTDSWHIAPGSHSVLSEDLTVASQTCSTVSERDKASQKADPSSNVLFDKYRQELQKGGYYPPGTAPMGMKPLSNTAPQRVSGKSESFHEEMSKKYLQELGLGAVTRQPAAKTRVQQIGQRSAPPSWHTARVSTPGLQDQAGEWL
ncbi:hypothetical protein GOODEAATRI_029293 [Goodea atripinnis]|uniref:Uncharacterized protein n=1 Tax=Goodea atripinnis TaxID=208336 RepID=A0ABV0P8P5_9TELE